MKTYLLNLWDSLRSSYWFVPSLCALGAILLSVLFPLLDAAIARAGWSLPEWVRTTTPAARATLSVMAGSMVAVTGTVFSITIVTLSLASQQFGPRLLRRFMYDLVTQVTLGVFLSTGLYCLLILRVVETHAGGTAIPHFSVLLAVLLSVLSMATLIVFIHHVAMMIQAPHVVAAVAHDLDDSIARLFRQETQEESDEDQSGGNPEALSDRQRNSEQLREQAGRLRGGLVVGSTQDGYVQAINESGLMQLACDRDLLLHMRAQPGDFIATGTPLADVLMSVEVQADNSLADELSRTLNESVVAGIRRTPRQDPECAIEELVEIAVRALSPGINDPFTAMNCIDRLGAALGRLSEGELPSGYRYDDTGSLRLVIGRTSFASALDTAFNQIRQHSQDNVAVTSRLLQALASIAEHVQSEEDREVVELHTEMVARHIENFAEGYDIGQVLAQIPD
jgi:uncharacterized membrane protein